VSSLRVYPEMGRSALAWGEIIPEGCRRVRPCRAFVVEERLNQKIYSMRATRSFDTLPVFT